MNRKHVTHKIRLSGKAPGQHVVWHRDREQHELALRINQLILTHSESEEVFETFSSMLWEQTRHDFVSISVFDCEKHVQYLRGLDMPISRGRYKVGTNVPSIIKTIELPLSSSQFQLLDLERIKAFEPAALVQILLQEGTRSVCQIPLVFRGKALGLLSLGSSEANHFTPGILHLLEMIAPQIALAMCNALAFQEIRTLREKLAEEQLYQEEDVHRDFARSDIIGTSRSLRQVLHKVDTVAPTDSTVLLLGETGTGKELIARAIHAQSQRQAQNFVKLNCSAIPTGLIESELFGHERGAFTGAIQRKVGRFELANASSLFLDEIGDLPLEVQPKLLRAIQEREFERLGSNQTIRVNVRLIAATHRDLSAMTIDGKFRSDLFYRLNVFPIHVPALRERKEDIPGLVRYFTKKYAETMGRRIERIPSDVMNALVAWPWPGNIRELQNLIERSVILSPGSDLRVPLQELKDVTRFESLSSPQTLDEVEREHIVQVLKDCRGVISGPSGAAARLGMKRTTLNYRMKRLGIDRKTAFDNTVARTK